MKFLFQSVVFFFSFLSGVQASLIQEKEETSKKIYFINNLRFYNPETSKIISENVSGKMKLNRGFDRDEENGLAIHGFNYNLGYKIPEEVFKSEFEGRTLTLSSYIKTKIPDTFRVQLCYVENGHFTSYGNSNLHLGDGQWHEIKTSIRLNKNDGTLHIRPISALYKPIGDLYNDDEKNAISILYFSLYLEQDNQNIIDSQSIYNMKNSIDAEDDNDMLDKLDSISEPRTIFLSETIDMKTLLEDDEKLKEALNILKSKGYTIMPLEKIEEEKKEDSPESSNKKQGNPIISVNLIEPLQGYRTNSLISIKDRENKNKDNTNKKLNYQDSSNCFKCSIF